MALARVVTFEGVDKQRMDDLVREMSDGEPPEGLPATEFIALHDADGETAVAIVFFDNEDDYRQGDATLSAMPADETPGRRVAVAKYDVAVRMTV